jgi:hypothetical protein
VRLDGHTHDDLDFQVIAPERRTEHIRAGSWYNIGEFRAGEEMIGRVHGNVEAVTDSISFMATIAWILYRAGRFYEHSALQP